MQLLVTTSSCRLALHCVLSLMMLFKIPKLAVIAFLSALLKQEAAYGVSVSFEFNIFKGWVISAGEGVEYHKNTGDFANCLELCTKVPQ